MITIEEIRKLNPGFYSGTDSDGYTVILIRGEGCGFTMKKDTKQGYLDCTDYNEAGNPIRHYTES